MDRWWSDFWKSYEAESGLTRAQALKATSRFVARSSGWPWPLKLRALDTER